MPVTMEEVRAVLDPEEPDYAAAALLGPEALPHLRELVESGDPMLASKAAYAAGMIDGDEAVEVLREAARSDEPTVRVAAAASVANLGADTSAELLEGLVADDDPGVRKVARAAVPEDAPASLRARLEELPDEPPAGGDAAAPSTGPPIVGGLMPGEQPGGGTMPGDRVGLMPGESRDDMNG
jgi:HEAT repeats